MRSGLKAALLTLVLFSGAGVVAPFGVAHAAAAQESGKPKLYDTTADGKAQIAAALKLAKAEDKRVILKFGANW